MKDSEDEMMARNKGEIVERANDEEKHKEQKAEETQKGREASAKGRESGRGWGGPPATVEGARRGWRRR